MNLQPRPSDEMPPEPLKPLDWPFYTAWPFPSKDNPLRPWTQEQVKEYEKLQRAKMPQAPM